MSRLPVIVRPGERMQTALLPHRRASRRRSLDRTHSRRSGLSVRTSLDAPRRTLLLPNPCGRILLLRIGEGAILGWPVYPITCRKWNALLDLARCIAPHCSRKLASRFARFGRRQYETTGFVESRRGGDVYGWRGAAAWPRGRSRENVGFRRRC